MSDQVLEPQAQQEIPPGAPSHAAAPAAYGLAPVPAMPAANGLAPASGAPDGASLEPAAPCTQAQLRRFIKSRPYVPLHELRRRFGLNGDDDDVSGTDVDGRRIFIGLPERETGLLGELLRQGDVGYELLLDPTSPIVIGVFPMRPVQRP